MNYKNTTISKYATMLLKLELDLSQTAKKLQEQSEEEISIIEARTRILQFLLDNTIKEAKNMQD